MPTTCPITPLQAARHQPLPLLLLLLLIALALVARPAGAVCKRSSFAVYPVTPLSNGGSAQFWFGRINLASTDVLPPGTILGSATATAAQASGINEETILWTCDLADAGQIYEVFSTNGDDRVGGAVLVGALDGLNGFYKTWFPGVGIRLTHVRSGKVLQRYYQSSRLDNYQVDEVAQKIYIRAKHLSPIRAEIARVSESSVGGYTSNRCPYDPRLSAGTVTYDCTEPNGYLMLRGPGYTSKQGVVDDDGEDHAYHYRFWGAINGVAFGMRKAARLSVLPSCAVHNLTPEVVFAPISISELEQGQTRQATFTISFKCDIGMGSTAPSVPGTDDNLTAFGIQASTGAYLAAILLGYVNADSGISYLLSDNYADDPNVAKGVGISLEDADTGLPMNFLSSSLAGQSLVPGFPGGQPAGWYRLSPQTGGSGGIYFQQRHLRATLRKLPWQKVLPGRVRSTAYVIVKVQ